MEYLRKLVLPSENDEIDFITDIRRTCYPTFYPFKIFPEKGLRRLSFSSVTLLSGGNGSGKSTLLNIIAEKTGIARQSTFAGSAFFSDFVGLCRTEDAGIPEESRILTSDDVFDYLLDLRNVSRGITAKREQLVGEYISRRAKTERLTTLADYEDWKEGRDAATLSQSEFIRRRLAEEPAMRSNGESAMGYFVENIAENALYLLDEPENSLSVGHQEELADYICDAARYFGCQFVIATHSPVLLAMRDALIYDLDSAPVITRPWTELENVRNYFDFFETHRKEFL